MSESAIIVLWLCSVAMLGRVLGQVIVFLRAPTWLPPMGQWQSGLVPYRVLLATQILVLGLMFWIAVDFTRASGLWVQPLPGLGAIVLGWSYLYAGAMVARYIVRMKTRPAERWFGGTIPIVFHTVLAVFQWTFARYHTTLS